MGAPVTYREDLRGLQRQLLARFRQLRHDDRVGAQWLEIAAGAVGDALANLPRAALSRRLPEAPPTAARLIDDALAATRAPEPAAAPASPVPGPPPAARTPAPGRRRSGQEIPHSRLTAELEALRPWADVLTVACRRAFDLRVAGRPPAEIGRELGCTSAAASMRVSEARRVLTAARERGTAPAAAAPAADPEEAEPSPAAECSAFPPSNEEEKREVPVCFPEAGDIEAPAATTAPLLRRARRPLGVCKICGAHDHDGRFHRDEEREPGPPAWRVVEIARLMDRRRAPARARPAAAPGLRAEAAPPASDPDRRAELDAFALELADLYPDYDVALPPADPDALDAWGAMHECWRCGQLGHSARTCGQEERGTEVIPPPRPVDVRPPRASRRPHTEGEREMRRALAQEAVPALDFEPQRPRVRGDCADGPRPCPWVSCQYHLALDVRRPSGHLRLAFPDVEIEDMRETCALDVADRGGTALEDVGRLVNLTRERVRQLETMGLERMRRAQAGEDVDLPSADAYGTPLAEVQE